MKPRDRKLAGIFRLREVRRGRAIQRTQIGDRLAFEPDFAGRLIRGGADCVGRGIPERQFSCAEQLRVGGRICSARVVPDRSMPTMNTDRSEPFGTPRPRASRQACRRGPDAPQPFSIFGVDDSINGPRHRLGWCAERVRFVSSFALLGSSANASSSRRRRCEILPHGVPQVRLLAEPATAARRCAAPLRASANPDKVILRRRDIPAQASRRIAVERP